MDDERAFIRSLSLALERRGGITHLYQTSHSREVMTLIEQNPDIELVLLDLNMPHISGDVLLKLIVERHPNVGVIIVNGGGFFFLLQEVITILYRN
ncbi:response regulator [uncultured Vibrio sp.]|uniref:response regulator transcription factor n=1 Tax=uncultured Vibrio sp. TaxID=114054 RepID=UPI0029C66A61|nr:response regulator [uncultured Vibrio sp.]